MSDVSTWVHTQEISLPFLMLAAKKWTSVPIQALWVSPLETRWDVKGEEKKEGGVGNQDRKTA